VTEEELLWLRRLIGRSVDVQVGIMHRNWRWHAAFQFDGQRRRKRVHRGNLTALSKRKSPFFFKKKNNFKTKNIKNDCVQREMFSPYFMISRTPLLSKQLLKD
jgi:hypothetical protein